MHGEVWILLNGIRTVAGAPDGWVDRASRLMRTRWSLHAEKFEYTTSFLFTRAAFQPERVRDLEYYINAYREEGWKVNLIGHSNGGELITRAVRDYPHDNIGKVVLIAGATEKDMVESGWDDALHSGEVDELVIFKSDGDKTLKKAAGWSQKLFGWNKLTRPLSYGQMGLYGPQNVAEDIKDKVKVIDAGEAYGKHLDHSEYFEDEHLLRTLTLALES